MSNHKDINDLVYPHHVIQLADLYLAKIDYEKHTLGPDAWIAICLYQILKSKEEIKIQINFDELTKNIGVNLRPIVQSIKEIAKGSLPNIEEIHKKILSLSAKAEDEILKEDLKDLVIFSLFIELIINEKLTKSIEIIDKNIEETLSKYPELTALIKAKLKKKHQYYDNNNTVIQGLLLIYKLNSDNLNSDLEKKNFRLHLFKWVKNVSEIARYIQLEDKDILPTSKVIREIYLNAIILSLLDYRSSCSLRKGDFQTFLDKLLGYNLYEKEQEELIKEILTINIFKHIALPLHYAIIIYTSIFVVLLIITLLYVEPQYISIIIGVIGAIIGILLCFFNELFRDPKYFIRKLRKKETN